MTTSMHINSLAAYHEERENLTKRARIIFGFLSVHPGPFTDRELMAELSYREPNAVRPRITEMIKKGLMEEVGSVKCSVTNKTVRLVQIKPPPEAGTPTQTEMF